MRQRLHDVGPDAILAAAKAWVAAADEPRFIPGLPKWLANRGWEKPPPSKRVPRQQQTARRKNDITNAFLNTK